MSIKRGMHKDVTYVYNGILLSHKKEWNNVIYSNMDGPGKRKLSTKELILLNCGVASLGLQGDPTSQSKRKSVLNIIGRTDAEAEAPILWPPHAKS